MSGMSSKADTRHTRSGRNEQGLLVVQQADELRIVRSCADIVSRKPSATAARLGKTGCKGRTIQMDRLDHLVADYLEHRLPDPSRVQDMLATHLDRREERDGRRRTQRERGRSGPAQKTGRGA